MSAWFKLLAVLVVFLCLYCHETDASKEWINNRFKDAKKMLSKRFNRETLDKFLNSGPALFIKKKISEAKRLLFKSSMGEVEIPKAQLDKIRAQNPPQQSRIQNHANIELPTHFDAREHWPQCPTISQIANQCGCGSCWAVASSAAFSDRLCIATNGTVKTRLSAMDLMSCCGDCKQGGVNGDGCQGGISYYAYQHFQQAGLVSGGLYGNKETCKPYKWAPNSDSGFGARLTSPRCEAKCENSIEYNKDKYYGGSFRMIEAGNIEEIQREIYTKGSVVCGFKVLEDFMDYAGGIYYKKPDSGAPQGGHAVRMIGWGEENGMPYWIVANSWGPCWGEKGTFRIVRGRNELEIEERVVAGDIDISRLPSQ